MLCDVYRFLQEDRVNPFHERKIRALSRLLTKTTMHVILTSPVLDLPTSLQKCITVVDYPLPEREQLSVVVENAKKLIRNLPKGNLEKVPTAKIVMYCVLSKTVPDRKPRVCELMVGGLWNYRWKTWNRSMKPSRSLALKWLVRRVK